MPNKTLYVSDGDESLWREAKRLLAYRDDKNLSTYITEQLRRYVNDESHKQRKNVTESILGELAIERARQISQEGYTAKHDDEHDSGEIAFAAACYAAPENLYRMEQFANGHSIVGVWPWDSNPKRKSRRSDLVRAAALIIAEIERIDRANTAKKSGATS